MSKKPYLNDGIIGNSKLLGTISKNGELIRLWWPLITYPQHMDRSFGGVFIKGESNKTLWMNDNSLKREQKYIESTNILLTRARHEKREIEFETLDFALPKGDTIVRLFKLTNLGKSDKKADFLYYSSFQTHDNKLYASAFFNYKRDAIVHFKHRYSFAIGSNLEVSGFTVRDAWKDAQDGMLDGIEASLKDSSCLSFDLGVLGPGESKDITIYISAGEGHEAAFNELQRTKKYNPDELFSKTVEYWVDYIKSGRQIKINNEKISGVYKRSLLVFKLLNDEKSGAIAAAPEVDEEFRRCGGYGYCWGRDAAYIVSAFDKAGYPDMSKKFFRWALKVQEKDGSFDQRYHMDGFLAPVWGIQIDETGAILFGIYEHYRLTGDREFISEVYDMVKKGGDFLIDFIDRETGLPKPSMDLWEERRGEHLYSSASVYGGLIAASKISSELGYNDLANKYQIEAEKLKGAILNNGWSRERGYFLRGIKREVDSKTCQKLLKDDRRVEIEETKKGYVKYYQYEDDIMDVSILGLSEPFSVIDALDERMLKTAGRVEEKLYVNGVGGLKRYEDDEYIGGNPWILTTLWLALYKIKAGDIDRAEELLNWAAEHSTELGLLPEQIDKKTGKAAWVIPLTWSHAMFVLTTLELYDRGRLR